MTDTVLWSIGYDDLQEMYARTTVGGRIGRLAAEELYIRNFTYIDRTVLEDPTAFFGAERLIRDLDEIEERWTFGFRPEELPSYLAPYGMTLKEDKGAAEYRLQYLPERNSILKGYEFYRVARAVIGP